MGPQRLLHQSATDEWYTPAPYLEAARTVMGGIDLDPASCAFANQVVQAAAFFDRAEDGLGHPWWGRVWLNPPYGRRRGRSQQALWSEKLIAEYRGGRVEQACLLVNAVPGNQWFARLWDYLVCFVDHRIRFYDRSGNYARSPTHSNAIVYLGCNRAGFAAVFRRFGPVVRRAGGGDGD